MNKRKMELAPGWGYRREGNKYVEVYDPFGISGYKNKRVLDRKLKQINQEVREGEINGKTA